MITLHKLLIANRGEIAVRVIRACRELGIQTVGVGHEVDRNSLHMRLAGSQVFLKSPRAFLDPAAMVAAAQEAGADAVHPGYGFLAENPEFARQCRAAGLRFVGPGPEAIAAMGLKTAARRAAAAAGVPVVPGFELPGGDVELAVRQAQALGYPVLVKSSAGGGGRGIRVARDAGELRKVAGEAAAEAQMAFGNGEIYIEKYFDVVRHVEVQVLADARGNIIHLGERECSVQRRLQKLVEESPSPAVNAELRARMGAAAVALAAAIGYESAGTVEFLLDPAGQFYFLEMNTRIQVEHPVTEAVTGLDLVKEQLRIATGEPLSLRQGEVELRGHAMECRINAEDPKRGFRPGPGEVTAWRMPGGPFTRADTFVTPGYKVPPLYDSLVAKIVVWGRDREECLGRMASALAEVEIAGIPSTVELLQALVRDPELQAGRVHTGWLERWMPGWLEAATAL